MKHTKIETSFTSGSYAISHEELESDTMSLKLSGHNFDVTSEFSRAEAMDLALQILLNADLTPDEVKKVAAHLRNKSYSEAI